MFQFMLLAITVLTSLSLAAAPKTNVKSVDGIWQCANKSASESWTVQFFPDYSAKMVAGSDTVTLKYVFNAKTNPMQLDLVMGADTLRNIAEFPKQDSLLWATNQANPKEHLKAIPKEDKGELMYCKKQ